MPAKLMPRRSAAPVPLRARSSAACAARLDNLRVVGHRRGGGEAVDADAVGRQVHRRGADELDMPPLLVRSRCSGRPCQPAVETMQTMLPLMPRSIM